MEYPKLLISSTLASALLGACGGGGGGTPVPDTGAMPAINSTNQSVTAQEAVSTAFAPLFSTQSLIGVQTTDESALFRIARAQLDLLPTYLTTARANSTLIGVVESQTVSCQYGGSLTVSVSDTDNNGVLSVGDAVTIAANHCVEAEGTITGSLAMTINSLTGRYGTAPYNASMTMSFDGFTVATSQASASLNGSISLNQNVFGSHSFSSTFSVPSLALSATYAGVTRSRSLTGYSATMSRSPDASYIYLDSYAAKGTVMSTALAGQSFSFNTLTPFVRRPSDNYPYSGVMLVIGGGNSQLRVNALSSSQVSLELDATGDGAFETNTTVNWNTLL